MNCMLKDEISNFLTIFAFIFNVGAELKNNINLVRRAVMADFEILVSFNDMEAKEAEGIELSPANVSCGILTALKYDSLDRFWIWTRKTVESSKIFP